MGWCAITQLEPLSYVGGFRRFVSGRTWADKWVSVKIAASNLYNCLTLGFLVHKQSGHGSSFSYSPKQSSIKLSFCVIPCEIYLKLVHPWHLVFPVQLRDIYINWQSGTIKRIVHVFLILLTFCFFFFAFCFPNFCNAYGLMHNR